MGDTEWPPEGTRVRIVSRQFSYDGVLGGGCIDTEKRWVHLGCGIKWSIYRHEIEVIEQEDSQ